MQVAVDDVASDNGFLIVPNKFLPLQESDITPKFIESQRSEAAREVKHEQILQRVIDHLKFLKFKAKVGRDILYLMVMKSTSELKKQNINYLLKFPTQKVMKL